MSKNAAEKIREGIAATLRMMPSASLNQKERVTEAVLAQVDAIVALIPEPFPQYEPAQDCDPAEDELTLTDRSEP